ncbi:MAG TPA: hypothetical protein VK892_04235, partial [Pyrinomonadaceae bacterium]|nr:hypothetical protein [Pyrinomonadaceae bacterium]
MKPLRSILALSLSFSLLFSFLSFAIPSVSAQDTNIALQRGYRTGYSDGYMAGYRDAIDNAVKNYSRHGDYAKADRAYNKDYGLVEDYRDGYQQGFEFGYDTGFEKRSFDATIPVTLKKRGVLAVNTNTETKMTEPANPVQNDTIAETTQPKETENVSTPVEPSETINNQTVSKNYSQTGNKNTPPTLSTRTTNVLPIPSGDAIIVIPAETELVIELADEITTEQTSEGDKFSARVVSPYEISGAVIEGRVSKIQKPGRIKRKAEVMLSFDRIILSENRWSNYNATLT